MNPEKLLSRHLLANGLTLELWDHSRPTAGDRWYVGLEARVRVPVAAENLPPELSSCAGEVTAALGPEIIFSQQDERHFIAASEVAGILQEMADRALELAGSYFGRPDFPPRLLRRSYEGRQGNQRRRSP